jgi:cell division protein FtsL
MWMILFDLLKNPKNLAIFILAILVIMISGYSVYNKFQVVKLNTKIVIQTAKIDELNATLTGVKTNLTTCNTNLDAIKDYSNKVNAIGIATNDIKKRINELKQPTTIVQPTVHTVTTIKEPAPPVSAITIENLKPPVVNNVEGGSPNVIPGKEDIEIITVTNSIIDQFNTAK